MKNRGIALLLAALVAAGAILTGCAPETVGAEAAPAPAERQPEIEPEEEAPAEAEEEEPPAFFLDVPENAWYHAYVRRLRDLGILPAAAEFRPEAGCTRAEFVGYLYGLNLAFGGTPHTDTARPFADVPPESESYVPVMWAYKRGVTGGTGDGVFSPDATLTREQCCTLLIRYAGLSGIQLNQVMTEPKLFTDSKSIRSFARSPVIACRLAGVISGYGDGSFRPAGVITHAEAAKLVCALWDAPGTPIAAAAVSTEPGAYDEYYKVYDYVIGDPVPESGPVPLDWFSDYAVVGDSVALALQSYCQSTKALGDATFLCAVSFSAFHNNNVPVSGGSFHPVYRGVKMKAEDGVAACGAKKVYISLGMNNLGVPMDTAVQNMRDLVDRVRARAPQAEILVGAVTPVAAGASVLRQGLTNQKIDEYNGRIQAMCREKGLHYIDINSALRGDDGWLAPRYCSDRGGMGIHLSAAAGEVWANYLITHVPEPLK